jgi:hypothetical protein
VWGREAQELSTWRIHLNVQEGCIQVNKSHQWTEIGRVRLRAFALRLFARKARQLGSHYKQPCSSSWAFASHFRDNSSALGAGRHPRPQPLR